MGKLIDLTGKTFGRLTVLKRGTTVNGRTKWVCQCSCKDKTILEVEAYCLRTGYTRSCGCYQRERVSQANTLDLTNRRFGRLIAVKDLGPNEYNNHVWKCVCTCGRTKDVAATHLLKGVVASCGCLQRDSRHMRAHDLKDQRFGRLIALHPTDKRVNKNIIWHCICDCGNECDVAQYKLESGETRSCGCLRSETTTALHLIWKTPEEKELSDRYDGMLQRCYNPNNPRYKYYGGAGVYVCDEWLRDKGAFIRWALANGFRPELTIDRYPDKRGPYAPWNCRWATVQQQNENRTSNVYVTVDGETRTITDWARIVDCCHTTISNYLLKDESKAEEFIRMRLLTRGRAV